MVRSSWSLPHPTVPLYRYPLFAILFFYSSRPAVISQPTRTFPPQAIHVSSLSSSRFRYLTIHNLQIQTTVFPFFVHCTQHTHLHLHFLSFSFCNKFLQCHIIFFYTFWFLFLPHFFSLFIPFHSVPPLYRTHTLLDTAIYH